MTPAIQEVTFLETGEAPFPAEFRVSNNQEGNEES